MSLTSRSIGLRIASLSVILVTLFLVTTLIHTSRSAKILMVSAQIKSHMFDQVALGEELVSRGHEVYCVTASRCEIITSIEKKGIKVLTYQMPPDVPFLGSKEAEEHTTSMIFDSADDWDRMNRESESLPPLLLKDCEYMMEDKVFIETVRSIEFDIAVIEPFVICPCAMLLPKHLGLPFVTMTGYYFPWSIRMPALPSFLPGPLPSNRQLLNLIDRLCSFFLYLMLESSFIIDWEVGHKLMTRYAVGVSSWKQLLLEAELYITVNDHLMDDVMPLMPNIIRLPGVSNRPSHPLPEDFEGIMTSAKDGVIIMTFGTSVPNMPDAIVKKFLDAFALLKQTVIVKMNVPKGWTVPKNVHIRSWLPQNDILGHPNTRLFITHCGNGGQYEALNHGVPMIAFPLFAEQHANAYRVTQRGFGLTLDIHSFTSTELFNSVQEILTNLNYTIAIRKRSAILHDEPMSSREKASFWIEHVIKHGGKHLRSVAMDMPTYQFLMIDIIALVFVTLLLFIVLFMLIIYCVVRKIRSKGSTKEDEKKKL